MERNRHLFWKNPSPRLSLFVLALCLFISPSMMANGNPNFTLEELDCDNVTEGGAIVGNQTLCLPYNTQAATITNAAFPSGGEGNIEYLWLQSSISDYFPGSPDWTFVANQPVGGSPDLTPGYLTSTTYYIRCARRDGCDLYVGESNIIEIKVANAPVISGADVTDLTCAGSPTGSIDLNVSGGTGAVTYTWRMNSPTGTIVSSNEDPSGLLTGNYYVEAVDNCGCSATFGPVFVDQPNGITITDTIEDLDCFGDENASITAVASGTTGPYTYEWDSFFWEFPFTLSNTISDLAPGTYTLVVTDANGCTATETYVINDPSQIIISTDGTNITCNGEDDGTTIVYVSGLNPPYTYLWSTGNPNNNMTNRPAGTYTVTVTDNNGCSEVGSYTVTEPAELTANPTVEDAVCFGDEGNVNFNVSGGSAPYTIDGEGTLAGTYVATITDANGCSTEATYTINQPDELVASVNDVALLCNGDSDASISVTTAGGSPGYNWVWSTGATGVSSLDGLSAGTYSVTVYDTHGCTVELTSTVSEPEVLTIDPTTTNVICNGDNNGTATANVAGGTTPYTITWSNGGTTDAIADLGPGLYNIDVVDANGCTVSGSVTITQPDALETTTSSTNITCNGDNDGTAGVAASGGTAPYTYAWSDGSTIPDLSGLAPGDYSVVVTDANGCTSEQNVTITEPDALFVDMINFNVSCAGAADGAATAAVGGGTGPYTFTWSNGNTNDGIGGLSGGIYTVDIVDANGCTISGEVEIFEPGALTLDVSGSGASCNGATDGSASASVAGGTAPYTYSWSNGSADTEISGLAAGTYLITATDANGCTIEGEYTVGQPDAVSVSVEGTDAACGQLSNGSATASATGGNGNYTYLWSTGDTGATISGLGGGDYFVTVTDANGCTGTGQVGIAELLNISASASATGTSCNGASDGTATAEGFGGTSYTYAWSNGATSQSISGLASGAYTVTVTDASGCFATAETFVGENPAIGLTASGTNVTCAGFSNGTATAAPSGGTGTYTVTWDNGQTGNTISGLGGGTYTATVVDGNGCTASASVTVNEPEDLNIAVDGTSSDCAGGGSAGASATGGTGAYTFNWSNGMTGSLISGLQGGTYSVTVTDANGCTASEIIEISTPNTLGLFMENTAPTCNGFTNGSATVTATFGGTAPYTYAWSTGATGPSISGIGSGSYTVTVTDANGCTVEQSTFVGEPTAVGVSAWASEIGCEGGGGGEASSQAFNGTPPYTYAWSNGASTQNISGLASGNYTVTATDANGCTGVATIFVPENMGITVTAEGFDANCGETGYAVANVTGGNGVYTYEWSNGVSGQTNGGLTAGTYTVNVTSGSCTGSATVTINGSEGISVTTIGGSSDCTNNGTASATAAGGSGTYTYAWSNGQTGASLSGLAAGTYTVVATDANGCTATGTATVSGTTDPGCDDGDCTNGVEFWDGCGCVAGEAPVDPGCDDGDCSNGVEFWDGCGCVAGTPPVDPGCDDGDCTNGVEFWDGCGCVAGTPPVDPGCDDGNCANGVEFWDGCGCVAGTPPVDPGCDDGDCTNGLETWDGCECVAGTPNVDPGCDDGDCSNGVETWDGCDCVAGTPPVDPGCDDGDCSNGVETWDGCECVAGTPPEVTSCDDGDACNGVETYDEATCQCVSGPAPDLGNPFITTTDNTTLCLNSDQTSINVDVANLGDASSSDWFITDENSIILATGASNPVDFAGAGAGVCVVWYIAYEGEIQGYEVGADAFAISGCYKLSNSISVTRQDPQGGTISTDDALEICAGDGIGDPINVTLEGATGENNAWVITDDAGNILGLPAAPPFDLDGAGAGTCLIWNLSFDGEITGANVGANAADLGGCYELSNPITVVRNQPEGGTITTTDPTTICAGDGVADPIDVTLDGNVGANGTWVITDDAGNILGLPAAPPFDLEGAGVGTCLIWHLSSYGDVGGAELGANASDLTGCYELSNPITVVRQTPQPSVISTTDPTTVCAADGIDDFVNVDMVPGVGDSHAWVITDAAGNILGLPAAPPFNFEGAGPGNCLIWCVDYYGELGGAVVGGNAADLTGCFALSDPIEIIRSDATSIGNYVWHDANQNGCQDLGELGIGQVLAQLVTAGTDGVFCTADDEVVDSEYTAFNGSYLFSCVAPGEYVVNFSNFPGPWQVTGQNACGDDENDSDVDPMTGCSDPFTVVGSGNNMSIDLGLFGSCLNHTDGGVIGSTQDVCGGFDVDPFESIEDPSGGTGITEYLWMSTTTPGPFSADTWTPISDSDLAAYASNPLSQTTYFIRCSRIQGCDTYVESNIITVSVINNPAFCFEGFIGIDADVITANDIQVRWSTNPEREDYQYHVEVSENGTVFETVGSMSGYGIDNAVNSYEFMHDNEKIGTIFYRVRRVANGITDYSETVSVNVSADNFGEIAVYPNPIKDMVNIKFMEPLLQDATAQLITPLGQVVNTVILPAGTITHNLDVSRYSVGTYFLKITNDELGIQGFKLVKPAQ